MSGLPLRTALLALLLTVVPVAFLDGPAGPPAAHAGGLEDEARRQLAFAEDELAAGRFDRTIASAESALRLDPTLYQAFVVKALAYEGLDSLPLAESLLIAYQELTRGVEPDPRVAQGLARIQAARAPAPKAGGRRAVTARASEPDGDLSGAVTIVDVASQAASNLDPEGYRKRVLAALDAGQCAAAKAAASEFALAQPKLADGYRFLGDAARCAGETREAVLAYRRFKDRGGAEASVDLMLKGLAANLGTLVVTVSMPGTDVLPLARLELPDAMQAPAPRADGTLEFADLPTGAALTLAVFGKGLRPTRIEVAALSPGERAEVVVEAEYVGLARIRVADHEPAPWGTTLLTPDGEVQVEPGSETEVTAAEVVALVTGPHGAVEVPLEVAPGATIEFDPTPWVPTAITVVDVPAGSTLRLFVEGIDGANLEREVQVPASIGSLDGSTGVRIAPPQRVDSMVGGVGGLFVQHPVLGEGAATVVLEPGAANATTFAWRQMSGVPRLTAAYERWSTQHTQVKRQTQSRAGVSIGIAVGAGVLSGILWGVAASAGAAADGSKSAALTAAATAPPDLAAIGTHRTDYDAAVARNRGAAIGGAIGAAFAGAGIALTVHFGTRGGKQLRELGPWDPAQTEGE